MVEEYVKILKKLGFTEIWNVGNEYRKLINSKGSFYSIRFRDNIVCIRKCALKKYQSLENPNGGFFERVVFDTNINDVKTFKDVLKIFNISDEIISLNR